MLWDLGLSVRISGITLRPVAECGGEALDLDAALHMIALDDAAERADEGVFPRISAHSRLRTIDLLDF